MGKISLFLTGSLTWFCSEADAVNMSALMSCPHSIQQEYTTTSRGSTRLTSTAIFNIYQAPNCTSFLHNSTIGALGGRVPLTSPNGSFKYCTENSSQTIGKNACASIGAEGGVVTGSIQFVQWVTDQGTIATSGNCIQVTCNGSEFLSWVTNTTHILNF